MFTLLSRSKYSLLKAISRSRSIFYRWKRCWNSCQWCFLTPPVTSGLFHNCNFHSTFIANDDPTTVLSVRDIHAVVTAFHFPWANFDAALSIRNFSLKIRWQNLQDSPVISISLSVPRWQTSKFGSLCFHAVFIDSRTRQLLWTRISFLNLENHS